MVNKVFANAPERCGSNFLCKFLQDEFNYFYVPPVHFLKYVKVLATAVQEDWPAIHERFADRLDYFLLTEERAAYRDFIKHQRTIDELTDFYFNRLFQETTQTTPVFKENELHKYFPLIARSLSNAAIVSQLRDPRMMWRSAKDIRRGFLRSKFGSLNETIRMWAEAERQMLFLSEMRLAEQTHFIRYEDLVTDRVSVALSLDDLPRGSGLKKPGESDRKIEKIASSSDARKNLTSATFQARTYANQGLRDSWADQHITNQLNDAMLRRGYACDAPSKLKGHVLSVHFSLREPLERLSNRWVDIEAKDGSRALYAEN